MAGEDRMKSRSQKTAITVFILSIILSNMAFAFRNPLYTIAAVLFGLVALVMIFKKDGEEKD